MTRRELLAVPAAGALRASPFAPEEPFPGTRYRDYARCLPDYLRRLAAEAYRRRESEIALLTTPAAIRRRQRRVREIFWELAGGEPERTPLNARVLGSFNRSGYRLEKVVYESRPNLHVTANLYIPSSGEPPFPSVLFQMGHALNGKANDTYQRCCQGLARLGYMVLAFDPMGQGERAYYPDVTGTRSRFETPTREHTVAGMQMLLVGDTSSRFQVWDAVRSLDYLAAHPLADPKRLASTGQSGGGTLTMLLAAVDDRLAAAVVCSGNTENFACRNYRPPGSTDDAEQNFPGAGPLGFDRWDLLYPLAPKPLLITVSDKDSFGTYSPEYLASGWEEFGKLKRVYEVLGHADRLAWADTPLPHGLSYDTRLHVYNWFGRWLKGDTEPVREEPPVNPEPDRDLWATPAGSTVRSFGGETPFSLTRRRVVARKPVPLERLLGVEKAPAGARVSSLRRVPSRGVFVEALDIPSARDVWLPAWLFLPGNGVRPKAALLVLDPAGRNVQWQEGGLYQSMARAGCAVCAADVRGLGDLAPEFSPGSANYIRSRNDEDHYAWASLVLGRPLAGQRVTDVLAAVSALREHPAVAGLRPAVAARGKMTVPALFAAAIDREITRLYLAGGLVSYSGIAGAEEYNHPFANFVPGILRHLDLPEVAASLPAARITLAGTVDAAGRPMPPEAVRAVYRDAANVEVRADARWDIGGLLAAAGA